MTRSAPLMPYADAGVFAVDAVEDIEAFYRANGFVVLRGVFDPATIAKLVESGVAAQRAVAAGELDERHGTTNLVDDESGSRTAGFPNYVTHVTEVSEQIREACSDSRIAATAERLIGPCWLLEGEPFGVVYQDARPGKESSYTRIGWHSDWQSSPHIDRWPSVAFTIHLDATSPENGFLRVVPGSHNWATPAPFRNANGIAVPDGSKPAGGYTDAPPPADMPLRFEKAPGEIALYCELGDVLLHDAYLWHSAARATDDDAIRRHIRGGWYSGSGEAASEADFVKNAAR